jgi:hypothetical protein
VVYGFGRIDASGRVADRVTITVLGWRCGDRLTLTADAGVLIARLDPGGLVTVPPRPYIVIPASLRRRWVLWLRRAHLWRQAARPTVTVPERQRVIYAFTGTVGQQASWPRLMSAAQLAASFRLGGLRDYRRRGRGARPNLCLTL